MDHPIVLITGALTGIGRATAVAFAKEEARVVVSGRHEEAGQTLAAELRALGTEAVFLLADVRFETEVRMLVEHTVARFGRIDVAVNNAGTEGLLAPIVDQSTDNYEATFATNVLGTLLSIKHEMRVMLTQGSGSIINLSSIAGQVGMPGASVYVASKHAVEGLTKTACARRRGCRRAGQCRGAWSGGHRDVRALRRQRGSQGRISFQDTGQACRHRGRDRRNHHVPRQQQGALPHRAVPCRRWRLHGAVMALERFETCQEPFTFLPGQAAGRSRYAADRKVIGRTCNPRGTLGDDKGITLTGTTAGYLTKRRQVTSPLAGCLFPEDIDKKPVHWRVCQTMKEFSPRHSAGSQAVRHIRSVR